MDAGPEGPRTAVHVFEVDTGIDRVLPAPPGVSQGWALWSADGRWISVQRWEPNKTGRFAILPADGRNSGIEVDLGTPHERGPWIATWSPDGSQLLEWLDQGTGLSAVDPATGEWHRLQWLPDGPADWQRVAP